MWACTNNEKLPIQVKQSPMINEDNLPLGLKNDDVSGRTAYQSLAYIHNYFNDANLEEIIK
jgi:hypothetical protein